MSNVNARPDKQPASDARPPEGRLLDEGSPAEPRIEDTEMAPLAPASPEPSAAPLSRDTGVVEEAHVPTLRSGFPLPLTSLGALLPR